MTASGGKGRQPVLEALRPCALAMLLIGAPAAAQSLTSTGDEASPTHRLSLYYPFGANLYFSANRTLGGIGGGVGVRDTLEDRFILQADARYLLGLRNVGMFRLGAGLQRRGFYTPALLLTLSGMFGEGFNFLTPEHPTAVATPAMTLGISVAPARFRVKQAHISVLEVGVGIGTELPGVGVQYQIQLLELGTDF